MYSSLPASNRRQVQASLSLAWLFAAGAGVSMWVPPPNPLEEVLGFWWSLLAGSTMMLACVIAALGVLFRRYVWEWVASWVAAAAALPYIVVAWVVFFTIDGLYSTAAALATSLGLFFVTRALLCAAHAAKLREVHAESFAVMDAITEGEKRGDGIGSE